MRSLNRKLALSMLAVAACGLAQAGDSAAALAPLEVRLKSAPDDLRLGAEYRQAVIKAEAYDQAIELFETLVEQNPEASNAYLNLGFAYVDKVPAVGSITQVILAERALEAFTKSVELKPVWLNLYTRGNSYLFWPVVFGRAPLGVKDLERAMEMQRAEPQLKPYQVRTFISLGDGYWKSNQHEAAVKVWREGLERYPNNPKLVERLALIEDDAGMDRYLGDELDPNKRVDTSLKELWEGE
ncbi:MAG: tetratricopeptide repeat protein [Bryobacterales bacterium]